jgi:ribosome-binding ATPase YchF (GTP1/OBG family)
MKHIFRIIQVVFISCSLEAGNERNNMQDIQFICRNELIADYIQNCESEMEDIKSKIEHLKHQETHWQKLENNVKHLRQMHQNYMNEISER